jgi:hypothetical protein
VAAARPRRPQRGSRARVGRWGKPSFCKFARNASSRSANGAECNSQGQRPWSTQPIRFLSPLKGRNIPRLQRFNVIPITTQPGPLAQAFTFRAVSASNVFSCNAPSPFPNAFMRLAQRVGLVQSDEIFCEVTSQNPQWVVALAILLLTGLWPVL